MFGVHAPTPIDRLDITAPAFKSEPYAVCAHLRNERPIDRIPVAHPSASEAYLVSRYEDALAVLRDERFVKDIRNARPAHQLNMPWIPGWLKPLSHTLLDADGDEHRRLRNLVRDTFTPSYVAHLEPRVQRITDQLLDRLVPGAQADLVIDFALPLPLTVIGEILGVPERDRMRFRRWVGVMIGATASTRPRIRLVLALPAMLSMVGYIRRLVRERRQQPRDDLVSRLVGFEAGADRLTDDELLAMIVVLLIAGYETTVNLISTGMLLLLRDAPHLARLREEPASIATAVEELLRLATPLDVATERYAREDVTIGNVTIPGGALVLVNIIAANTDERRFPRQPEALDLEREDNHHLAFGHGAHYCLGAPLARMEGRVALGALIHRLPNLRLGAPPESLRWRRALSLRSLESLPVTV
jgi:cytochrome P450